MSGEGSNVHPVADFEIIPFFPMRLLPPASNKPNRAVDSLMQWVESNNFPKPMPDDTPSPAAIALFTVITTNKRNLRIQLRSTPPSISVSIQAILPNSRPALINSGCDSLRLILWHITRNSKPLSHQKCGFQCDGSCMPATEKSRFHLSHIFKPTTKHDKPAKRPRKPNCDFLNLPDDVLLKIIFLLNPCDFVALSDSHPYLHDFLLPIVPGLKLRLFPHQLHALSRMSVMETRRYQDFPLLEELPSQNLQGFLMTDLVDGSVLLLDTVPRAKLPVGGLFCDEPGLGKTITALSLVLRTAGNRREAPPNTTTSAFTAPCGKVVVAYKDKHIRRLSIYGESTRDYPARKARLMPELSPGKRRSSRTVRIPDFLNKNKGVGSVPVVEEFGHIYLSGGSLIAVPTVLVGHWQTQIEQHVRTKTIQVLYIQSKRDLPEEALVLATYDIVLVSHDVLESIYNDLRNSAPTLLQVNFKRVIVDEGHRLSAVSVTKLMSVCDRVRAEARWVMTGTPTPATPRSDIDCMQPLLTFIHDEGYGLDEDAWGYGIYRPYLQFKNESLERLTKLMSEIMIRADKSILKSTCHIKNVILEFSEESADSYNGLVRMARRNLITSDWFDAKHKESLLNSKNAKESRAVMANLRKACCFGGTMDVNFNRDDVAETLDELYEKYRNKARLNVNDRFKDPTMESHLLNYDFGEDEHEKRRREDIQRRVQLFESLQDPPLRLSRYVTTGQGNSEQINVLRSVIRRAYTGKLQTIGSALLNCLCQCAKCGTETKYPLVTPCAHMLCDECIETSRTACPVEACRVRYRMDEKSVPEDLIELQPSIQSHQWRDDWADTKSSKMSYLIKRIESLPLNEEWVPEGQAPLLIPPKVIVHSEYGDHLKLVALHMKESEKLSDAYVEMVINTRDVHHETKGIKKASDYAIRSVKKFAEDPKTQVLLMNTKHGALGLDLSFVQYIFLLEPLWDAANELQIVSRAHRIGCKDNIYVERLVMKGSVEEDMVADLERSRNQEYESSLSDIAKDKLEKDFRKTADLLRKLKVVTSEAKIDRGEGSNLSGSSGGRHEGWVEDIVIQDDVIRIEDTDEEVNDSSDSGPGVSEMEFSESNPPILIGISAPRGVLKRRRSQREHSAEPRRVRFRE